MGLFSSILGAVPVVGDIIGAASSAKATSKAGKAQIAAAQLGVDEQRRQYDTSRADFQPYMQAGTDALSQIMQILGLGGGGQAAGVPGIPGVSGTAPGGVGGNAIIDQLKSSPLYQSLFRNGQEAVLQNASATGGLRGGNAQASLYNLGEDTLSRVIQQQLANLSAVSAQGSGSTAQIANLGANAATQISQGYADQGAARAGSILGQNAIYSNLSQKLQGYLQSAAGGAGGLGSFKF